MPREAYCGSGPDVTDIILQGWTTNTAKQLQTRTRKMGWLAKAVKRIVCRMDGHSWIPAGHEKLHCGQCLNLRWECQRCRVKRQSPIRRHYCAQHSSMKLDS